MRGIAYRRHQTQRAYSRARRLISGIWGIRVSDWTTEEDIERYVRIWATDRHICGQGCPHHYRGGTCQTRRAALNAHEQVRDEDGT